LTQKKNRPSYREILERDASPVADVLGLTENPPQAAADISFERYTSDDVFDAEIDKVWRRVWQVACREEHIPAVGDYFVYDIGRLSIIVVRSSETEIKGYVNSCLHRGTKLKQSESVGRSAQIQCPFHGWTWNLTGELQEVPCSWEFEHLDYEANCLPEALVDTWNGFVFINMDVDAPPLLDYLGVLPDHFEHWRFDDWYVSSHIRKEVHCNWKLAMEGFMEAYHTPVVHPQMSEVVGDWNMQHDIFGDHVSRDLCAMGVSSPSLPRPLTEEELLNRSRPSNPTTSSTTDSVLAEGKTARMVMAEDTRERFMEQYGMDLSTHTDAEVIDSLKYNVFPNMMIHGGAAIHALTLFRPLGHDPTKATIDRLTFLPVPADGPRPEPAEVVTIREDESYGVAPGITEFMARVLDQDTSIMRLQQEGIQASAKGAETLSSYQESRVRWAHDTFQKYLAR
jgi:phenylpropionate dioxygenase-like ring-hydroxylating dioxygenase large terminal subunit